MKKTLKILNKKYDIETTTVLDLSYEGLTEIPKEVNELINLRKLYLNNNKIKNIENINKLVKLKQLFLYRNKIERIEGLDNNINLRILHIDDNKISKIENLNNLIRLEALDLGCNNIKKIENIHHLNKLEELYVFSHGIPENIEKAKRISIINSRKKKLEKI